MINGIKELLTGLAFLSRIPIPVSAQVESNSEMENLPRSFWLAGLILGLINATVACILLWFLPESLAIAVFLGLQIALTGAFHEDGFADLSDAMGGYTRERRFEIMRDSRLGTFGVVAIGVILLIRWSGYQLLWVQDKPTSFFIFLVLSGGWMRWASVVLLRLLPYIHHSGKGIAKGFNAPSWTQLITSAVILLILTAVLSPSWLPGIILAQVITLSFCYFFYKRVLGGVNGDCLGACSILSELVMIASVCSLC